MGKVKVTKVRGSDGKFSKKDSSKTSGGESDAFMAKKLTRKPRTKPRVPKKKAPEVQGKQAGKAKKEQNKKLKKEKIYEPKGKAKTFMQMEKFSKTDLINKVWERIKGMQLLSSDGANIQCDEGLKTLFGQPVVNAFFLSKHVDRLFTKISGDDDEDGEDNEY